MSNASFARRPLMLIGGLAALLVSPIVSMIQFVAGDHTSFWAGLPLFVTGIVLVAISCYPRGGEAGERYELLPSVTFEEVSSVIVILAMLFVYGRQTIELFSEPLTAEVAVSALIGSTIALVIIIGLAHIPLAFLKKDQRDERDREIDLISGRNGHYVLAGGVWGVMFFALSDRPVVLTTYALMGVFILSELVRYISQIVYYRLRL